MFCVSIAKKTSRRRNAFQKTKHTKIKQKIFTTTSVILSNKNIKQTNYATSSGPGALQINYEGEKLIGEGSYYSLEVPLPKENRRLFSIRPQSPIKDLIGSILAEDPTINLLNFYHSDGTRVSRATPFERLLEENFKITIDDKAFLVRGPPKSQINGKSVTVDSELVNEGFFKEIQKKLKEEGEKTDMMSMKEFKQLCEDLGVGERCEEIANALHELNVVFFFGNRLELKGNLYLNPKKITESVEKVLALPKIQQSLEEKEVLLERYEKELAAMFEVKKDIEKKSYRYANVITVSGLAILCVQFVVFARLTWWDYSWDVIEPVTYFVTIVETIFVCYLFHLFANEELTFVALRDKLYQGNVLSSMKSRGFDMERYQWLKEKVSDLKVDLTQKKTD